MSPTTLRIIAWGHTTIWTLMSVFSTVRVDIPLKGHPDYPFLISQMVQILWIQWAYRQALKD